MGKCLTIVKLVGIGSLGIASFAIGASIVGLSRFETRQIERKPLVDMMTIIKSTVAGVGSLATYLFYTGFKRARAVEQHPYLIYSALAFPVALGLWYWRIATKETELASNSIKKTVMKKEKKLVKELVPPGDEKSPLDNSYYGDLGSRDPVYKEIEIEIETPTTVVVELDDESLLELTKSIKSEYLKCLLALSTGFFISLVGYIGEA